MVDVKHKVCEHEGCTKVPYFNEPGQKAGRYCAAHKLRGMVNVRSKLCEHEGCTKGASFNDPSEKTLRFCAAHKLEGMINLGKKRTATDGQEVVPTAPQASEG